LHDDFEEHRAATEAEKGGEAGGTIVVAGSEVVRSGVRHASAPAGAFRLR
jgi:hypothetical protein